MTTLAPSSVTTATLWRMLLLGGQHHHHHHHPSLALFRAVRTPTVPVSSVSNNNKCIPLESQQQKQLQHQSSFSIPSPLLLLQLLRRDYSSSSWSCSSRLYCSARTPTSRWMHSGRRRPNYRSDRTAAAAAAKPNDNDTTKQEAPRSRHHRSPTPTTTSAASTTIQQPKPKQRPPLALPDKDREQELGRAASAVTDLYRAGRYASALTAAQDLLRDNQEHFSTLKTEESTSVDGSSKNNALSSSISTTSLDTKKKKKNQKQPFYDHDPDHHTHPAIAAAHHNVALMHKSLGHYDLARSHYETALLIYRTTVGPDHASTAATLHNLGQLVRTQIHVDVTLTASDRYGLIEMALQYLQQATDIRMVELGPDHPHTVASRSGWGATLATQVLHHYKRLEQQKQPKRGVSQKKTMPKEQPEQQQEEGDVAHSASKQAKDVETANDSGLLSNPTEQQQQQRYSYVSMQPTSVTEIAWDAAEEHLRAAYQTSLANPRGRTVPAPPTTVSATLHSSTKKKPNPLHPSSTTSKTASDSTTPQTLSAASAAQNLAVFLKARASTIVQPDYDKQPHVHDDTQQKQQADGLPDVSSSSSSSSSQQSSLPPSLSATTMYAEAETLYRHALRVQESLLPNWRSHPDRYATLHSLAELLESTGQSDAALPLRQEIVDAYHDDSEEAGKFQSS